MKMSLKVLGQIFLLITARLCLHASVTVGNFNTGLVTTFAYVTPEPSTLVMLGSGVLGLAGVLRRKINPLLGDGAAYASA